VQIDFDNPLVDESLFSRTIQNQQCTDASFRSFSQTVKSRSSTRVWPREFDLVEEATTTSERKSQSAYQWETRYIDGWKRSGQVIDFDPYEYEWYSYSARDSSSVSASAPASTSNGYCWVQSTRQQTTNGNTRQFSYECNSCQQRMIGPLLNWAYRADIPADTWVDTRRRVRVWEKRYGDKCGADWLRSARSEFRGPREYMDRPSHYEKEGFGGPEYAEPDMSQNGQNNGQWDNRRNVATSVQVSGGLVMASVALSMHI
jgi:hypothetical protein